MSEERLAKITDKYNKERNNFSFPTIAASSTCIKSIVNIHKDYESLNDDDLVYKLAVYLNDIIYGWN